QVVYENVAAAITDSTKRQRKSAGNEGLQTWHIARAALPVDQRRPENAPIGRTARQLKLHGVFRLELAPTIVVLWMPYRLVVNAGPTAPVDRDRAQEHQSAHARVAAGARDRARAIHVNACIF